MINGLLVHLVEASPTWLYALVVLLEVVAVARALVRGNGV